MRKKEGKEGGEAGGGEPEVGGPAREGRRPEGGPQAEGELPVGRLSSARKQCVIFFKATDLIS